jgi:hypothetical protein
MACSTRSKIIIPLFQNSVRPITNLAIEIAIRNSDIVALEEMITLPSTTHFDIASGHQAILRLACQLGNIQVIRILTSNQRVDPREIDLNTVTQPVKKELLSSRWNRINVDDTDELNFFFTNQKFMDPTEFKAIRDYIKQRFQEFKVLQTEKSRRNNAYYLIKLSRYLTPLQIKQVESFIPIIKGLDPNVMKEVMSFI